MKSARTIVFLLLTWVAAQAQAPLPAAAAPPAQEHEARLADVPAMTLEQLEAAALEANPETRVLARGVDATQARVSAAGALDDPSFMYRGWGVPWREPWNFNQAQNMFAVTQAFPGPGKRALRSRMAQQDVSIARAVLEAKKREVAARVRTTFYGLLRNSEELRLHEEQVSLARQGMEAARIKYTVGRVPQQDLLKAQIGVTRLVDHLLKLQQDGRLMRVELNTLLGRDPDAALEVTGDYAAPGDLPPLAELERIALENRPELEAASAAVERSATKTQLAGKGYTPDYSVSFGYMLQPAGSSFRNAYMAEVSVSLPWFNRRKHDSEIAEARAEGAAWKAEYQSQRATVFREIQEALIRAKTAKQMVELYRDTLRPQTQTSLKAATAAYRNDRTDFLNLLDSQNAFLDVEYAYVQAQSDYEGRLADLERAVGAPLPARAPAAATTAEVKP
jgi:cobalt-zinc-cadmium efflux system outer membrane protein